MLLAANTTILATTTGETGSCWSDHKLSPLVKSNGEMRRGRVWSAAAASSSSGYWRVIKPINFTLTNHLHSVFRSCGSRSGAMQIWYLSTSQRERQADRQAAGHFPSSYSSFSLTVVDGIIYALFYTNSGCQWKALSSSATLRAFPSVSHAAESLLHISISLVHSLTHSLAIHL